MTTVFVIPCPTTIPAEFKQKLSHSGSAAEADVETQVRDWRGKSLYAPPIDPTFLLRKTNE